MTVEEFLDVVFDEKPLEAELKGLPNETRLDWTSKEYWGDASNRHHLEIIANGRSVYHDSFTTDGLYEKDEQALYSALAQYCRVAEGDVPALTGEYRLK